MVPRIREDNGGVGVSWGDGSRGGGFTARGCWQWGEEDGLPYSRGQRGRGEGVGPRMREDNGGVGGFMGGW